MASRGARARKGMPMTSHIDELLARARLRREPYTGADIDAALTRLAARVAVRRDTPEEPRCPMPHTRNACGSADVDPADADQADADQADADAVGEGALDRNPGEREAAEETPADENSPCSGQAREGSVDESSAADDLQTLCETVITHTGALTDLRIFLARALPEPSGARVLGCMLQLSEREESARFWWQYAAGAAIPPPATASICTTGPWASTELPTGGTPSTPRPMSWPTRRPGPRSRSPPRCASSARSSRTTRPCPNRSTPSCTTCPWPSPSWTTTWTFPSPTPTSPTASGLSRPSRPRLPPLRLRPHRWSAVRRNPPPRTQAQAPAGAQAPAPHRDWFHVEPGSAKGPAPRKAGFT